MDENSSNIGRPPIEAPADASGEPKLVADRSCGSCNVCCVALTIRDPELQKVQGRRCPNARPDNSCAIYDNRPRTCRTFYCGWRQLKWVRQTLRPDISGVLVRLHQEKSQAGEPPRTGVIVTLLNRAALKADGLAESLAAAVAAAVPVYLEVPGPPGYTYGMARINDALIGPVLAKNKATVLVILRQAWAAGRAGAHHPIDMAPDPS